MLSIEFLIALVVIVVAFTGVAAVSDIRFKRLPNKLTVPAFGAALVFHFVRGCWEHGNLQGGFAELVFWSLAGFAVGFGIHFVLFAIAGGGGGDVKLMGAVGAWLGWKGALFVYFVATIFIIVLAMGVFVAGLANEGVNKTMQRYFSRSKGKKHKDAAVKRRMVAYAVPVALAVWVLFGLVVFARINNRPFWLFERGATSVVNEVAHV